MNSLHQNSTDPGSEHNTIALVKHLHRGSTSYGMWGYTRFPPGPAYFLYPFWAAFGARYDSLRMVPITFSAIAYGVVFFGLFRFARSTLVVTWLVVFGLIYAIQPAYANWQRAIYEHSFGQSFIFLTLACAVNERLAKPGFLMSLGFLSGWTGYSGLPAQVCMFAGARIMTLLNYEDVPQRQVLWIAGRDMAAFISGAFWAILTHFFQLCLYFGYTDSALIDLLNSAMQRAGMMSYKIYRRFYPAIFAHDLRRWSLIKSTFGAFTHGYRFPWTGERFYYLQPATFYPAVACAVALMCKPFVRQPATATEGPVWFRRLSGVSVGLATVVLSSIMWIVLMRFHAGWHFYYTSRHFIFGFFMLGIIPALVGQEQISDVPVAAETNRETVLWLVRCAIPAVLLVGFVLFWTKIRMTPG